MPRTRWEKFLYWLLKHHIHRTEDLFMTDSKASKQRFQEVLNAFEKAVRGHSQSGLPYTVTVKRARQQVVDAYDRRDAETSPEQTSMSGPEYVLFCLKTLFDSDLPAKDKVYALKAVLERIEKETDSKPIDTHGAY
jgi:hypothetical protein